MRRSWRGSGISRTATPAALLLRSVLFCGFYFAIARFGLLFTSSPDYVSPIWPLSGLAFVLLLRNGIRLWPAIFVADLLTGYSLGIPLFGAVGIAAVTTLEVVLALALLRPWVGPSLELDSLREVLALIGMVALVAIPISATLATLVFVLLEPTNLRAAMQIWRAWWIGDVMGILAIVPTILAIQDVRLYRLRWTEILEGAALFGCVIVSAILVMANDFNYNYLLIIFVIWAALRFGPRMAALAIALICIITVWQTALGQGPFVVSVLADNLFYLQTFLAVLAITGLIVAALVAETRRNGQSSRLLADVGAILARPGDEGELLDSVVALLADWADGCVLQLVEVHGLSRTVVALTGSQQHREELVRVVGQCWQDRFSSERGSLATGPVLLQPERDRSVADQLSQTETEQRVWERVAPMIAILIPIRLYSQQFGCLLLFSTNPGRMYHPDHMRTAREVAQRIAESLQAHRMASALAHAQKYEALGHLASGIAHDFNNLLTVIVGSTGLAKTLIEPENPVQHDLNTIDLVAGRAQTLVQELRYIGRNQPTTFDMVDINALLERSQIYLRPLVGSRIELVYTLDPQVGKCLLDAAQFERVLVNLVANARDAMPTGGTVTIKSTVRLISEITTDISGLQPGRYIRIDVCDTGVGIAPELVRRIFDPYVTTKQASGGTGLGLAISLGIIKQFQGTLLVDSQPGRGSQFMIYLPAYDRNTSL